MSAPRRVVLPQGSLHAGVLELPPEVAVHVRDVLRAAAGEALLLCDGAGAQALARVQSVGRRAVTVQVEAPALIQRPGGLRISLLQGVAKGEKMDLVVRQASELGAARIVPVLTARAVARQEGRLERWQKIAEDGIRVSGRAWRPEIIAPRPLDQVLDQERQPLRLCLALGGAPLRALLPAVIPGAAAVLIGPEGGLGEAEVEAARVHGFAVASLGKHTLRTETAGPAVLAMLGFWSGALG